MISPPPIQRAHCDPSSYLSYLFHLNYQIIERERSTIFARRIHHFDRLRFKRQRDVAVTSHRRFDTLAHRSWLAAARIVAHLVGYAMVRAFIRRVYFIHSRCTPKNPDPVIRGWTEKTRFDNFPFTGVECGVYSGVVRARCERQGWIWPKAHFGILLVWKSVLCFDVCAKKRNYVSRSECVLVIRECHWLIVVLYNGCFRYGYRPVWMSNSYCWGKDIP